MQPIQLTISAFASYPGTEHVAFDNFRANGLFLVTGPTGSGKSTLFDAICYALYGRLPADRPDGTIRSHHAAGEEKTYVQFEFTIGTQRYRVKRSPAQERRKEKGIGNTTEPAAAEMQEWRGGTWHPKASGVQNVNTACETILGLSQDQFEQVVLLPQGKFQQFLLAGTKERRELLSKLFRTHLYSSAVDRMKEQMQKLEGHCVQVTNSQQIHTQNATQDIDQLAKCLDLQQQESPSPTIEGLVARLNLLTTCISDISLIADNLDQQASTAHKEHNQAETTADLWKRKQDALHRLGQLHATQGERDSKYQALSEAKRATKPKDTYDRRRAAFQELHSAERSLETARKTLHNLAPKLGITDTLDDPIEYNTRLTQLSERHTLRRTALGQLNAAQTRLAEEELAEALARNAVTAARQKCNTCETQLQILRTEMEKLHAIAASTAAATQHAQRAEFLVSQRQAHITLAEALTQAERDEDHAEKEKARLLSLRLSSEAASLAAKLRTGEPCLVCGSTTHPSPAEESHSEDQVTLADIENASRRATEAFKRSETKRIQLEQTRESLGAEANRPLADLRLAADKADAAAKEARDAQERLNTLEDQHTRTIHELAAHKSAWEASNEEHHKAKGKATSSRDSVAELRQRVGQDTSEHLEQKERELDEAKSALQQYNKALGTLQQAKTLHDAFRTQLQNDLATSQFATEDAVLRAFRSPTEIQALESYIESHDSQERKLRETLEDLSSAALPNDCPDVAQLQQIAEQAKSKAREARDRVTRADMYCKNAQSHLRKAQELDAEAKKSRDAADLVSRVFQTCDGKGKGLGQSRISLETWVLTAELERVTAAASERLLRMTAGRYRLQRTETAASGNKQAGLDLEVFDSHTGRTRATGTLSGGEQFQASLALALGLADVVSHGGTGSGNVYGTLFIDEGFGSLDPEALEQVIDTLDTLRDGGRMVGVITHVEAMKQALPIGIEVLRRPDGRGSTLRK